MNKSIRVWCGSLCFRAEVNPPSAGASLRGHTGQVYRRDRCEESDVAGRWPLLTDRLARTHRLPDCTDGAALPNTHTTPPPTTPPLQVTWPCLRALLNFFARYAPSRSASVVTPAARAPWPWTFIHSSHRRRLHAGQRTHRTAFAFQDRVVAFCSEGVVPARRSGALLRRLSRVREGMAASHLVTRRVKSCISGW
jgi:hypothetical protein